ncbi:nitroreductase family protein [Candidatus Woesearchaeota archaeon]|nr:nitroreductase family protein [Candidatus Woesearchaeota archaeon]
MQQHKHFPRLDVLEAIRTRRSIRKYTDMPVEWDKIGTIVDAGRVAPSSGNLQCWRFIVVDSIHKRKALAEACLKQYWMEEAPVHILIVMMLRRIREFYGKRGTDFYAVQEAAMAAQNMMLAAHTVGLGSCFVSAFGYAAEQPQEPIKYRIENITFMNRWAQQNVARMKDIDNIIWNFRVAERGIKFGGDLVNAIDLHTRAGRKRLTEQLKDKAAELKKRVEEGSRKAGP